MIGVAVNVTDVPAHTSAEGAAEIEMLIGRIGLTDLMIKFETAGFPFGQVSLEFRVQVTLSLFNGI